MSHKAALLAQQGGPLVVADRPTPTPGPGEILLQIKAVALNPVDHYQRDKGFPPIAAYPTVIGNDAAGIIAAHGPDVPSTTPPVGTRVLAFASGFYHSNKPDYGAFQEYALVMCESITAIPASMSFEHAAMLPLGILTALSACATIDIPLSTRYSPADNQAILIWGGASSMGSLAIQVARRMGFAKIYTTASSTHHFYLHSLGATRTFDYHDSDVVEKIVATAEKDQVALHTANAIVDNCLPQTLAVLKRTRASNPARIAHTAFLAENFEEDGVSVKFTRPPQDAEARREFLRECFQVWLKEALEDESKEKLVPSPKCRVANGGLEGLNNGLDKLSSRVSGEKIVLLL